MKKILFLGSSQLSLQVLGSLINNQRVEIVGVVTGEEYFKISYSKEKVKNFNFSDLSSVTRVNNIPIFTMNNGMKDPYLRNWINELDFDYILVVGWYHMIPADWIEKFKCLGVHASLLPKYRGGAPLVWAMLNGESETGVSLFQMDNGVDTGAVIAQRTIPIEADETIASLLDKVAVQTVALCREMLPKLEINLVLNQKINEIGPIFPQRKPEDGRIGIKNTVAGLSRFIRAQTKPYPGAYLQKGEKKLYLWKCTKSTLSNSVSDSSELILIDDKIAIPCLDGVLIIIDCSLRWGDFEITDPYQIEKFWSE